MIDFERRFTNAIRKKRLAHALLFLGDSQELKERTALDLLSGLFCERQVIPYGCRTCMSCRQVLQKHHPRVRFLLPEGEHNVEIRIDQIRDLIGASGQPSWIIPKAHLMNKQASNAFLKTLEEPRGDQFFILMSPNTRSLLPTLVSRCQRIFFGNSDVETPGKEFPELPSGLLERMELIEQLAKEKSDLPAVLSAWQKNASLDFRQALLTAQENLKKHANPQLILEELLLSKKV